MVVVAGRLHIVRRVAAEAAADRLEVLAAAGAADLAVEAAEAMSHPAAEAMPHLAEAAMPHLAEAAEATAVGVTKT